MTCADGRLNIGTLLLKHSCRFKEQVAMVADGLEGKVLAVAEGSGEGGGEGSKRVIMLGKGSKFSDDGFDSS